MQYFDFEMDKSISNNIGPWDQSTIKNLCIDWKFYELFDLNICLNNQEIEICSRLKKENERKENLMRLAYPNTQPQESSNIQETKNLKPSKIFLNKKSNSFMSYNNMNNLCNNEELPQTNKYSTNTNYQSKSIKKNFSTLTRAKSAINVKELKNIELIEKQINRHLKELEFNKINLQSEKNKNDDDDNNCEQSLVNFTNEDQISISPSTTRDNPSAIYRIKKLEEMQIQNARKSSKGSSISLGSAKINEFTKMDYYAFKFTTPTVTTIQNKINNDIELRVKPLLNRSATIITRNQNFDLNFDNNDQNTEEYELKTDINKFQMSDEFNQIISISPIARVKSVAFKVDETKFNERKKYSQLNDRIEMQSGQIKSRSYSNCLPKSASNKLLRTKSNQINQNKNSLNDLIEIEKSIVQLRSESFNSLNKSQFKSSLRLKRNLNLNRNIFDLIRVDGKSYSTISDNIENSNVINF